MKHQPIIQIPPEAAGKRLSDFLNEQGYAFSAPCGGRGVCKKCRVRVIAGTFLSVKAPELAAETDTEGYLLACQALCPLQGAEIALPDHSGDGLTAYSAELSPNSQKNSGILGVALDIGTTTLAAALVDCESSQILATASCLNPQQSFGADVISRISACKNGHLQELQNTILHAAANLIAQLREQSGKSARLSALAVSGNTTMLHLFCGISPEGMGAYPFIPAFTEMKELSGASLGLDVEKVIVLPSASAFIGSDIVSGILVSRLTELEKPSVLMDIGTNGEMVLCTGARDDHRLITASTAAGPALEGASISCGMGGIAGAVSKVLPYKADCPLTFRTIGDAPAQGICGCGLIDLTAYLLDAELLDETGYLEEDPFYLSGAQQIDAQTLPVHQTPVSLTQKDIREFQLAKSAIRAGFEALIDRAGLTAADIGDILIAGGIGYYWDAENAAKTGILPREALPAVKAIGNSSLAGAVQCLTDPSGVQKMTELARACESFELNTSSVFNEAFIEHMMFPEPNP